MNKNSIEEDMKYIHKTLNDMKIKDEDAFMSAVAALSAKGAALASIGATILSGLRYLPA